MNSSTVVNEGVPCSCSLTAFQTPKAHPTIRAMMSPRFTDSVWIGLVETSRYRSIGTPLLAAVCQKWGFSLDRNQTLLADYQHYKAVRKNWWPWMWIIRCRRRARSELGRNGVHIMRLGVESHGASSAFGLRVFRDAVFIGRLLLHDRHHALPAGGKGQPGFIVVGSCVHAFADRGCRENFAAVGIDYRHHLVVASGEEAPILAVDCQSTGLGTGRERPFRLDFQLIGIDRGQLALVLDIDEHCAFGIAGSEFRLAVELDRAQNFSARGIDRGRVLAASVESEHAFGRRVVEDR